MEVSREGRVLLVTFNQPKTRNELTPELCVELQGALETADADPAVGAILLQATGEFFSVSATTPDSPLFGIGDRLRKPLVAAVQGPAIGTGLALVANAHVAIAAQGCSFGVTDIRQGSWPKGLFPALKQAIGQRRAVELCLTGRVFGTQDALLWGLIHQSTPAFELEDTAFAAASALASANPQAITEGLA